MNWAGRGSDGELLGWMHRGRCGHGNCFHNRFYFVAGGGMMGRRRALDDIKPDKKKHLHKLGLTNTEISIRLRMHVCTVVVWLEKFGLVPNRTTPARET